jgi:TRAP-type transport system periplasmic protein
MWDGWWFLVNRRAWQGVPDEIKDKVSTIINTNAVAEREEIARQNTALKSELATKGLIFNDVDPVPFREALSKSGFYAEWKGKFGEQAWALLEESTGKLA